MSDVTTSPPVRSRWLALVVLCAGMLMIILDGTIVNVALPAIQDDLGFSQADLAWVVNAYLIAFGGAAAPRRPLRRPDRAQADVPLRPRRSSRSPRCSAAWPTSQGLLIGARFLQGVGGAMTSAVILGMIVTMFPEPREQAKAIGIYSFVASAGASIGLLAGGVLTEGLSWHWIFFVNVPIGVATAVLALRLLDHEEGLGLRHGADVLGAALVTGVADARRLHDRGGRRQRLGLGADARPRRRRARADGASSWPARRSPRNPLLPLRLFRSRNVSGANVILMLLVAGMFGMFFLGTLYLERVLGYERDRDRPRVPARVARDRDPLARRLRRGSACASGARPVLLGGLTLIAAGLAAVDDAAAPVDGVLRRRPPAGDAPARRGAGISFPAIMTLAMSRRRRQTPACSPA